MSLISFRTAHEVRPLGDGRSVVESNTAGIGHYVQDPDHHLQKLNKILNGTLNQQEATEQIAKQTGISPFNAHTLLEKLIQLGHIEAISQPNLTPEQQTRFSRSTALYSWLGGFGKFDRWAPQEIICSSSICILGAGGIGSSIALQMAASGIGKITLVDFDTVELSNLNRQIAYSEKSIGKLKTDELKNRIRELNSDCSVRTIERKIEGVEELNPIFKEADLAIRAIDNPPESAYWVSEAAIATKKPWIDCSYAGPMAVCATFVPGTTGCYRCLRESEKQRLQQNNISGLYEETPLGINAAIAPIVSIASALASLEALRFLVSRTNLSMGKVLHQNLADYSNQYSIDFPSSCQH